MITYYFMENNQQKGPVTKEELRIKNISRATMVWTEGMAEWQHADSVSELSDVFPAIPPPPPVQSTPPPPPIQATPPPVQKPTPPTQNTAPPIPKNPIAPPPIPQQSVNDTSQILGDSLSGGMKFLSFFIPLVGLVIYFTNKGKLPNKSSDAGKMALYGIIFWTFINIALL